MSPLLTVAGLYLLGGLLLGVGWTSLQRSALTPVARAVHEQQQPVLDTAPTVTEAPSDHRVLTVASSIPTTAIEIGTMAVTTAEKLARVSDGRLELKLNEPGTLFPTSELFDKLSNGDVDAVWASTNQIGRAHV